MRLVAAGQEASGRIAESSNDDQDAIRRAPSRRTMRRVALAGAVVVLLIGGVAAVFWRTGAGQHDALTSWRLQITPTEPVDGGCTVTATSSKTGETRIFRGINGGPAKYQMPDEGNWTWDVNDTSCEVTPLVGSGQDELPFERPAGYGDTDAFDVSGPVEVAVDDPLGQGRCPVQLRALEDGSVLDRATPGLDGEPELLDPGGRTGVVHLDRLLWVGDLSGRLDMPFSAPARLNADGLRPHAASAPVMPFWRARRRRSPVVRCARSVRTTPPSAERRTRVQTVRAPSTSSPPTGQ